MNNERLTCVEVEHSSFDPLHYDLRLAKSATYLNARDSFLSQNYEALVV